MINRGEVKRLEREVLQKLLYDIRKELEADGAVFTESMTDADLLKTDSQTLTQLVITADTAQELRDGHFRILFEDIAKRTKRNRRLK